MGDARLLAVSSDLLDSILNILQATEGDSPASGGCISGDADDSHSQSSSGPSIRRSQSLQPAMATHSSVTVEARTLLEIFLTRSWSVNLAENLSAISERPSFARLLQMQESDSRSQLDDGEAELASNRRGDAISGEGSNLRRPAAYSDPGELLPALSSASNADAFGDATDGDVDDAGETGGGVLRRSRRRHRRSGEKRFASTSDEVAMIDADQFVVHGGPGSNSKEDADDAVFDVTRRRAHTDITGTAWSSSSIASQHHLMLRAFNVAHQSPRRPLAAGLSPKEGRKVQQQQQPKRQMPLRKANIVSDFRRACQQQQQLMRGDGQTASSLSDKDLEDRLDHVAAMLDTVAKDFFGNSFGGFGTSRQESVPFCLESALQAKEGRVLKSLRGSEGKAPVDEATLDSLLASLDNYEEFSAKLTVLLLGDLQAWRCVAMLYLLTRLLCQRCNDESVAAVEKIKSNCLRHFDQRYAQWVLQRGGWQAVVDETEESELD